MLEQQPQPQVQPQITPLQFIVGQTVTPAGTFVVLQVLTVVGGPFVFLLPADHAVTLGEQIKTLGKSAATGLILPSGNIQ